MLSWLLCVAGVDPSLEDDQICSAIAPASEGVFVGLATSGTLFTIDKSGNIRALEEDISDFSIDPFLRTSICARRVKRKGDVTSSFIFLSISDNSRRSVTWDGNNWVMPFWYSLDKWGAVRDTSSAFLERQPMIGGSEGAARVNDLALANDHSKDGWEFWTANNHVRLLTGRPLFGENGSYYVLLGMFEVGSIENVAHRLFGVESSSLSSGFLLGTGGRSPEFLSISSYYPSRARILPTTSPAICALTFSVKSPEPSDAGSGCTRSVDVLRYDLSNGKSERLPLLTGVQDLLGLAVAFDVHAGKDQLVGYRREDGALIYLNESRMEVLQTSDQVEQWPVYGHGPLRLHSDVAMNRDMVVFCKKESVILVDLNSLEKVKVTLPATWGKRKN